MAGSGGGSGRTRVASRLAKLRAKAFRSARRHTITVKSLRFLLPIAVLSLVGAYGFLLFGTLSVRIGSGQLQAAKVEISKDDLKMKGVSYAGKMKDGGHYDVRAREAQVDILQQGPVTLAAIEADLVQPSGVTTKLTSSRGVLDNKQGQMDLLDGVTIDMSNGFKARMKSAKVLNKDNRVLAKEGVDAETATGRIVARTMDLETKARKGVFTGDVMVRMTPDATAKSPLGGISGKEARAPLDLTAQKLDFDDNAKVALFTGGVTAVQGESQLAAQSLRVTYEGKSNIPGLPQVASLPGPAGAADGGDKYKQQTKLSKLQADGRIVITQGSDRRIAAESMTADIAADTVLFTGPSVEIHQGKNRLLGRRLYVDRKLGRSQLSSPAEGRMPAGRIKTTFYQSDQKAAAAKTRSETSEGGGLMQFRTDPNAPMDIEAATLDVNDPEKKAIFRTAVRAQQGDFVIQASELVANYTGETGLMSAIDQPQQTGTQQTGTQQTGTQQTGPQQTGKGQGAQISRIEANENVLITSKDGQEARGKKAVFEAKSNSVVLSGNVQVKQGSSVVTGSRLRIDMNTGVANVEQDGTATVGGSIAPITAAKSAPGPGGLPAVGGATIPQGLTPGARPSISVIPEELKKQNEELKRRREQGRPPGQPVQKAPAAAAASSSPSPVYRSPGQTP